MLKKPSLLFNCVKRVFSRYFGDDKRKDSVLLSKRTHESRKCYFAYLFALKNMCKIASEMSMCECRHFGFTKQLTIVRMGEGGWRGLNIDFDRVG